MVHSTPYRRLVARPRCSCDHHRRRFSVLGATFPWQIVSWGGGLGKRRNQPNQPWGLFCSSCCLTWGGEGGGEIFGLFFFFFLFLSARNTVQETWRLSLPRTETGAGQGGHMHPQKPGMGILHYTRSCCLAGDPLSLCVCVCLCLALGPGATGLFGFSFSGVLPSIVYYTTGVRGSSSRMEPQRY